MKALDLFCKAGGASAGLAMAGFDVTGIDIEPQPNYPYKFIKMDVMQLRPTMLCNFDLILASPPCQSYSDLAKRNGNGHEWPRLVEPIREILKQSGKPYVIENVEGAPLIEPVRLCGTQFKSLRVLRHRLFEASFPITDLPHGKHPKCHTHDKRKAHFGKTCEWKDFVQVTGGGNSSVASAANAMGIWWMTKDELNEAIPPGVCLPHRQMFFDSGGCMTTEHAVEAQFRSGEAERDRLLRRVKELERQYLEVAQERDRLRAVIASQSNPGGNAK